MGRSQEWRSFIPVVSLSESCAWNGSQFISRLFSALSKLLGKQSLFSKTNHPQINSQVERYSQTVLSALRLYIANSQRDWDLYTDAQCYVDSPIDMKPSDLVSSRVPGTLALQ